MRIGWKADITDFLQARFEVQKAHAKLRAAAPKS